jgi:hypothetical protein
MIRSKKITNAARGEGCTIQVPGYCNGNDETVVFCHFPDESHGMGIKADDISGAFGCSGCHDFVDRRNYHPACPAESDRDFYLRRAQTRTMRRLFELGVLKVA